MANAEHVKVVLAGPDEISRWRREHPTERLDLRRAELWQRQLTGCDLSNALLDWADLRWADLIDCNITNAHCERADFHKADLERAVLDRAIFCRANFEDARLHEATCNESVFGGTKFLNTELGTARGLATAIHRAPSLIDDETLRISPSLPTEFLRGCGLFIPFRAVAFRVILGGPADVEKDVAAAREAIHEWNDHFAQQRGQVLLPIWWKTHALPSIGAPPQALVNRQLIDRGDILVALFWQRLGTPTEASESGTAEEISRFANARKPILIYFCKRAIPISANLDELQRLRSFGEAIKKRGLIGEYSSAGDLCRQLARHLAATVDQLRSGVDRS